MNWYIKGKRERERERGRLVRKLGSSRPVYVCLVGGWVDGWVVDEEQASPASPVRYHKSRVAIS